MMRTHLMGHAGVCNAYRKRTQTIENYLLFTYKGKHLGTREEKKNSKNLNISIRDNVIGKVIGTHIRIQGKKCVCYTSSYFRVMWIHFGK